MSKEKKNDLIRQSVRKTYADIAKSGTSCCCGGQSNTSGCCVTTEKVAVGLGYSEDDIKSVPEGANMGLGCGNPQAIAALQPGEVVVDLGSGGGFDCFLAAKAVGDTGHVIGVDMTPDMISKARANAGNTGYTNVEFRLGEIEHLPVADNTADVMISNCVINLSPDKHQVYKDAFRILKKGGRIAVSDVVALQELPATIKKDMELYAGCVAGALTIKSLQAILKDAGFSKITITLKENSKEMLEQWVPGKNLGKYVASANIEARK